MKDYNQILVLENDTEHMGLPSVVSDLLKNEPYKTDIWFNFSYSFYNKKEENFKRLSEISEDTLLVSYPSFVGLDNQFDKYLLLFFQLKTMNIKIDINIIFYEDFEIFLLKFLSEEKTYLKKERNHEILKEILDFHNIYVSPYLSNVSFKESAKLITYDNLMFNYYETHRKLEVTKCKVKSTGEIYDAYYILYYKNFKETKITLKIEGDFNNSYRLDEIEKIK
jgi:hypothetical protein